MNFAQWHLDYCQNRGCERLGQAFCNDFIKDPWSELYYAENGYETYGAIWDWLEEREYIQTDTMPEKLK